MIKLLNKQEKKDCKSYTFTINDQMNFQILAYNAYFGSSGDKLCLDITFYNTHHVYPYDISVLSRDGFTYKIIIKNNGSNFISNTNRIVDNEYNSNSFLFPVRKINDICLCVDFHQITLNSSEMRKTMSIIEAICTEMDEVEHFIKTEFLEKYI